MSLPPFIPNNEPLNGSEAYLAKNADELEYYIAQGNSFYEALAKLHHTNGRPTCIVCGGTIKRAKREAVFCRRHEACRSYARRYVYLYRSKGLTKAGALAQIFEELSRGT